MTHPLYRFFATVDSIAPTILRLLLTLVLCVHGVEKTPGWSDAHVQWTDLHALNLGNPLAVLGIAAEMAGAAGMFLGFLTRLAALAVACVMAASVATTHWQAGFLAPAGYEYPLSLGVVAVALMCCGGGRFSVDRLITRRLLPPNTGMLGSYRTL